MARLRRSALLLATLGLAVLAGIAMQVALKTWHPPLVFVQDIAQEWLLARSLLDGDVSYPSLDDLKTTYGIPTNPTLPAPYATPHPPTAGVVFLPLAALDYVTAARLWFIVQCFLLILGSHLCLRIAGLPRGLTPTALATMAVFANPVMAAAFYSGQTVTLQFVLLAGAVLFARSGRNSLAGGLLGLAIAVKPLLWLALLFLLLRRSWHAMAGAAAALVTVATVGALMAGPGMYLVWLSTFARDVPILDTWATNMSLWLLGPAITAVVLVVVSAVALRLPVPDMLGLAAAVGAFLGPIAWGFYALLLLVPLSSAVRLVHARILARSFSQPAEASATGWR